MSLRMRSDKRYNLNILYDILNCHCIFHDILQNIFFCSYSSLVCPTAPSYSPPAGPPEMGSEFFLSWAFFFSGKRWGQNFFSFLGIFSLCCDQVDDEGGNQVQKDKSNLFLGAGECISAQQSPIRHISRRGREGAGLLIS